MPRPVDDVSAPSEQVAKRAVPTGHPRLRFPVRPIMGRWPGWLEALIGRVWTDPAAMFDPAAPDEVFAKAVGAVELGGTFKITQPDRHAACDDLLLDHVPLAGATIVDIGASDGSTSVDLIARLPADFAAYVIADRYLEVQAAHVGGCTLLFDPDDGRCILAFGKRWLAWPHRSRAIRLACSPLLVAERVGRRQRASVPLLNPRARALVAADPRVTVRVHDVFRPWDGPRPDVVKVANLLRRVYFDDDQIQAALDAIRTSLPEGGHLLVVDNPYLPIDARAGLYRRDGDRFALVALTAEVPEINDLVLHHDPDAAVGRQEVP